MSRSIVDALKIKLSSGEIDKISERLIDNVQAYDYYLRAKRDIFECTPDALKRACSLWSQKSLALRPRR